MRQQRLHTDRDNGVIVDSLHMNMAGDGIFISNRKSCSQLCKLEPGVLFYCLLHVVATTLLYAEHCCSSLESSRKLCIVQLYKVWF